MLANVTIRQLNFTLANGLIFYSRFCLLYSIEPKMLPCIIFQMVKCHYTFSTACSLLVLDRTIGRAVYQMDGGPLLENLKFEQIIKDAIVFCFSDIQMVV